MNAYMQFVGSSSKDLELTYERINNIVAVACEEELSAMAQEIMDNSVQQVPKGTGTLADSAYKTEVETDGGLQYVEIGYGGPADKVNPATGQRASEYATKVHEDLMAKHTNGKAKFLEDPTIDMAQKYSENIAYAISRVL